MLDLPYAAVPNEKKFSYNVDVKKSLRKNV